MDRRVPNVERKHRLNREIMVPRVRLNGVNNEPLGIVSIEDALRMSGELDVDLVEIAATADPPVCRLMDYGKFKYLEQKKAAEAKSWGRVRAGAPARACGWSARARGRSTPAPRKVRASRP